MEVLLYLHPVDDKKNGVKFDKDKVSYRGKTFDAVIAKSVRPTIANALASGLRYPLLLNLDDTDYFTKLVTFTRNDGSIGEKARIVITGVQSIAQGRFESKTLDEIVDNIEQEYAERASK